MDSLNNHTPTNGDTFPKHALPKELQYMVEMLQDAYQFPVDYSVAAMIYATSIAIGNTHKVEVKRGWQESPVIYMALVGRPGSNKSHPLTWALSPIFERDGEAYTFYQKEYDAFKSVMNLTQKERRGQGIEGEPAKPVLKKHIVQDFTPEALTKVHEHNLRGLGVYADELASWFKNFDRYSKGSEEQFWLSNWSGKPIVIDRKGDNPILIKKPFISVCGTIQNGILTDLAKDSRSRNGFMDRMLFAIPECSNKPYPSEKDLHPQVNQNWFTYLSNLLDLSGITDGEGNTKPQLLKFTSKAKAVLNDWNRTNTDLINGTESESIAGLYTKLEVYLIRLSLILQMLDYTTGESAREYIEADTVERAILLVEYFRQTGLKVQGILNSTPYDRLSIVQRNVYDLLPDNFHTKAGLNIAHSEDMPAVTFKRLLQRSDLFIKERHGQYSKKF
ncbi:YfjI family protein [Pontibacter lucknowensis]|uniref:DUF3987 domain-containing protein n=1 Tax=Pontibacter lucknowensis TaxID=1077936 RepID=A0A1N7A0M1_9BACT|nr:YfjI family protein [Pontibacter lucknowensis]SIR32546.1 Protein of unknown function [Pontibacter lucknowensis]